MIRDQGPKYNLGFGLTPADVPMNADPSDEEGPNPNSSFIAKALTGHPVMRFFAVTAASLAGMHVAQKLVASGGVKLASTLEKEAVPFLNKEWQTNVMHDFRSLQKTLNEWQGVSEVTDEITGRVSLKQRAGFWASQGDKQRAYDAWKKGDFIEDVAGHTLRDEIQQTLVKQARRLPYELPALYATQRLVTDRMVGGTQDEHPKWYNPVDVIGDFSRQSLKNVATLVPWELGQSGLKQGYRSLMTYGDFVTGTPTFSPRIKGFSQGLRGVLSFFGHDASQLIYKGTQVSQRTTGAFSTAINEYVGANRDTELRFGITDPIRRSERKGVAGAALNTGYKVDAYARSILGHARDTGLGLYRADSKVSYAKDNFNAGRAISNFFPKVSAFGKGFMNEWDTQGEYLANQEAVRAGDRQYMWQGEARDINRAWASVRTRGNMGSEIEQIASSLKYYAGQNPDNLSDFTRAKFMRIRQVGRYKGMLEEELIGRDVDPRAARKFVRSVAVDQIPQGAPTTNIANRLRFGEEASVFDAYGKMSPWHEELQQNIHPVVGSHAESVVKNISDAVLDADTKFIADRKPFAAEIQSEWKKLYNKEVLPWAKGRIGEAKLPHEMFEDYMTPGSEEVLVRKTAERMGVALKDQEGNAVGRRHLVDSLERLGFNMDDQYDMRNFLVQEGVVSKPWESSGHNIFGLRPLSVKDALKRGYIKHDLEDPVRNLLGDINATDPYVGDLFNRPVGRGVYTTKSGQIVDFTPFTGGARRMANLVQENFQIPLLHIRPLNLFGYGAARQMAQSAPIRFSSDLADQRFLGAAGEESHMWLRDKGSRGRVFGLRAGGEAELVSGAARPFPTDPHTLLGRTARLAGGTEDLGSGMYSAEAAADNTRMGRFKRAFDIDPDQQQSLFRYVKRMRESHPDLLRTLLPTSERLPEWARKGVSLDDAAIGDLKNPANLARWLLQGNLPHTLSPEQVEAYAPFVKGLRRFGLTRQTARLLEERGMGDVLSGIDTAEFGERGARRGPLRALSEIRNPDDMTRVVQNTLREHEQELDTLLQRNPENEVIQEQAIKIRRAQGILKERYLANEAIPGYFDQASAQAMRSTGIHTRLDEFRADMYRYLAARKGILAGAQGESVIQDMLEQLESLKEQKLISGGEYVEARAAALSMQLNYLNLDVYQPGAQRSAQVRSVLGRLARSPEAQSTLHDISRYETELIHKSGMRKGLTQGWLRRFGQADYDYPGVEYNPFGGNSNVQFVNTFGENVRKHPFRTAKNVIGATTWSDPETFNPLSVPVSHFWQRLNRYFSTFGLGVDESAYKGPLGFFAKGLVGRRVLPAVAAGATLMTVDRTLGGWAHRKDDQDRRRYTPLVGGVLAGGVAHGQAALAGIVPGGETRQERREELFGEKDVAIRKGRWWPLGNQPWKGGRVQYFRPSWYRRMKSGYQYTGQDWTSPLERAAFGYDFSPLRPLDPYHWERKHYKDRPYPATGEYFTGPWGPLTGAANLAVGHILKPTHEMHGREVADSLADYQQVGQFGMAPQQQVSGRPLALARNPTGSFGIFQPRPASEILGRTPKPPIAGAVGPYPRAYRQPYGFLGVPYGTDPNAAAGSYRTPRPMPLSAGGRVTSAAVSRGDTNVALGGAGSPYGAPRGRRRAASVRDAQGVSAGQGTWAEPDQSGKVSRAALAEVNAYYTGRASGPPATGKTPYAYDPYNRVVMAKTQRFDPRTMPANDPINPKSVKFQLGQLGYETQEMFGIYGFVFGQARKALGFGSPDFTPRKPVLQSAGRGYGSERSYWDLNLGGLGDLPNASEGEYGNMEISEIMRRFIPHRRRDIHELNPIRNQMGQEYPWLPGNDYFLNFQQGDPYIQVPEGEMRLPGAGYERTHRMHPDVTGKYGLMDQHAILGDVAPWSQQYRAIDQVIKKMNLSEEDLQEVRQTRKQVSAVNKRHEFRPYKYAHTEFTTAPTTVTGFKPGDPEVLMTDFGLVRLAGVRARSGQAAREFVQSLVQPGDEVNLTYDANRPPPNRNAPLDVIMSKGHTNINRALLNRPEYSFQAKTSAPVDLRVTHSRAWLGLHAQAEMLSHRNTILNTKFLPNRTAVEDWERTNIYGSSFPQWQHPVRDFLKPIVYRAKNRNPFLAAAALSVAGGMFGTSPQAHAVGALAGAATGFTIGLFSDAKSFETGQRFIPPTRKREAAIEEYTDILNYVKYSRLYSRARQDAMIHEHTDPEAIARKIENSDYKQFQYSNIGPATSSALAFRRGVTQTMYGTDVYGDVMNLSAAIPKRKRDHFLEFLNAPIDERKRILSTAPRLERRIYEARWGLKVERRPDLNQYFTEHELPDENWEGWNSNVNLDSVKLKVLHQQGIDASQMGYFPQQVEEANLLNPAYPNFNQHSDRHSVNAQLRQLMSSNGISGNVYAMPSSFPGSRVVMNQGVG